MAYLKKHFKGWAPVPGNQLVNPSDVFVYLCGTHGGDENPETSTQHPSSFDHLANNWEGGVWYPYRRISAGGNKIPVNPYRAIPLPIPR